ncbi:uncharacterized protein LOC129718344 [Wyeomyia smithii]|uniref:uncharacterized protein LOC129718344 n=1 Tax=Wyeomyia smithii TaxID=174621 RepID=UPI002467DC02|nr:uncharacterized protein LOC129718344 [Wyeomyia smithii]
MMAVALLNVCVLCCLVTIGFSFEPPAAVTESYEPYLVTSANYGLVSSKFQPSSQYTSSDHQHEKRDAVSHRTRQEALPTDPQAYLRDQLLPFLLLRQPFMVSDSGLSLIPQRDRKAEKRELSIQQMLEGGDYFVPNRGRKRSGNGISKKIKFDDILGPDDFIPNRGKKEFFKLISSPVPVSGQSINELQSFFTKKNVLSTIKNVSSKEGEGEELFFPTRGKKGSGSILDNLARGQDTFFSSRGRRNPIVWSLLNEEPDPWEYAFITEGTDDSGDLTINRYQTNKIIK